MKLIKKGVILLFVLICALFLSGCLDYKSYYDETQLQGSEDDLIKELAEIEKELGLLDEEPTDEEPTDEEPLDDVSVEEDTSQKVEIVLEEDSKPDTSNLDRIVVKENELVSLDVGIDDPDKDNIDYSFSLPLTKEGKWKTNYGDAGEYVVTVTASDGRLTSKKDVLLVIERVNVPPMIKSIEDISITEGEIVKLEPQVIDPNGDSVTVELSKPLTSGVWNTDHTSAGEYSVTVTASDGELESKHSFLLVVKDVNVLPEIDGLSDMKVDEGETVSLKPTVTDLDKDVVKTTVTVTCSSGCQFLNPGDVAKTCDRGCDWQTSYTDHGTYKVEVTANDGKEEITKEVSLVVKDQNQPPVIGEIKLG